MISNGSICRGKVTITLEEGQSLTVQVEYDLSDGEVYYAAGGGCPDANNFCVGGIDLVPSLVQ